MMKNLINGPENVAASIEPHKRRIHAVKNDAAVRHQQGMGEGVARRAFVAFEINARRAKFRLGVDCGDIRVNFMEN